jgi:hypothetical protein
MADCLDPKQSTVYYNRHMKVFQIQDEWGMQHLKLAAPPAEGRPRAGPAAHEQPP